MWSEGMVKWIAHGEQTFGGRKNWGKAGKSVQSST